MESLVCYLSPEPRDIEQAGKQICASFILKSTEQDFRIPSQYLSECQKHPYEKRILDIDVDNKEKYSLVMEAIQVAKVIPKFVIESRGGYHILCYDLGKHQNAMLHEAMKKIGDVDMLKNALIPIPGTFQGGIKVNWVQ